MYDPVIQPRLCWPPFYPKHSNLNTQQSRMLITLRTHSTPYTQLYISVRFGTFPPCRTLSALLTAIPPPSKRNAHPTRRQPQRQPGVNRHARKRTTATRPNHPPHTDFLSLSLSVGLCINEPCARHGSPVMPVNIFTDRHPSSRSSTPPAPPRPRCSIGWLPSSAAPAPSIGTKSPSHFSRACSVFA